MITGPESALLLALATLDSNSSFEIVVLLMAYTSVLSDKINNPRIVPDHVVILIIITFYKVRFIPKLGRLCNP